MTLIFKKEAIPWGSFLKCLEKKKLALCTDALLTVVLDPPEVSYMSKNHKRVIEALLKTILSKQQEMSGPDEVLDDFLATSREFLINFTAEDEGAQLLGTILEELNDEDNIEMLYEWSFTNSNSLIPFSQLLSNVTRMEVGRNVIVKTILPNRELMELSTKIAFFNYRHGYHSSSFSTTVLTPLSKWFDQYAN